MFDLLKELYDKVESIKGRKLVVVLVVSFVSFILIGGILGYFIQTKLNQPEYEEPTPNLIQPVPQEKHTLSGKIEYVNPDIYTYSYVLVGEDGKDQVLLEAKDEKLRIAEGLYVSVTGVKNPNAKIMDLEVLVVEEVIISNVAD